MTQFIKYISLLALIILLYNPKTFADNGRGELAGRITDEDGQPVAGAMLVLNPDKKHAHTDKNGFFSITQLYPGIYHLTVSMIGFQSHEQEVEILSGRKTNIIVKIEADNIGLSEVTVSTKKQNPDNLLNIQRSAMPVTVIDRQTIELMGSRRLDEVLKEQTGIAIVSNISGGARSVGVQMQGFGSEYVMILIDGQPMLGRNSGNFDLSRISVTNIERIEIIKGASSCLFGSEALGGAINIVTRHGALQPQTHASIKYGSLNMLDATLEGETPFASQRGSVNLSANYYRTDGFNTDPAYVSGVTAPPYDNYNLQGRSRYRLTKNSFIGASGRYALRKSFMTKDFGLDNVSADSQNEHDLNLSTTFNTSFKNNLQSLSRYYYTYYNNNAGVQWQQTGSVASADVFTQNLHRFEQQFAYNPYNTLKFTAGLGGTAESMNNTIFSQQPDNMYNGFGYLQADWFISKKLEAVGGLRYDRHNSYGSSLNPSFGLQYHFHPKATLKLAAGSGFKAPDFKNRYLVFYNPAANYLVIGTEVLRQTLTDLQNAGQISNIKEYLLRQIDGNLQAEKSNTLNVGLNYRPTNKLKIETSVFYHKIYDQINTIQIATGQNSRQIFTYQNLPEVVNKGIDVSFVTNPYKNMEISAGYQYLESKDQSVLDSIRTGRYHSVRNNETGETWTAIPSDYWGIENRSRHMLNFKAFYSLKPRNMNFSFRVNYRSKYPFVDANNNKFIDRYDTFVDGFFLLNASVEKKLMNNRLSLQLTVDNIMDYIDRLMPAQPGRIILAGLSYRFYRE